MNSTKYRTRLGRMATACTLSALTILAGAASALAAPVSVGHSGWTWGDPSPQGETLRDVVFSGARGYAVGDFGTVLRSDDGGNTWIGLASGTRNTLGLVQEVDPNTVVVGGGCTVRESTNAGQTFQRLPVEESESKCASTIASFSFLSASTGYVEQSTGAILLTTDGGQTLTPKTSVPLNGASAGEIDFVSQTVGFALTGGGRIYRTTDGANSWTQVGSAPAQLADIVFVTPTTAYAVGANDTLLQSTDEGATWHTLPLTLPAGTPSPFLARISCSDVKDCLIATAPAPAGGANVLVRTTDGGMTGSLVSPSELNLLSVAFSTASGAVAVGEYGATVLSSDGGATFPNLISHNLRTGLHGLIRLGSSPLVAYAPWPAGQIAATTNGGESWGLLRAPTSANIADVAFPSPQVGYALSSAGTVFRTVNGGSSWSILTSGTPAPVALLAPNPSTLLLFGPTGVRRSTNSGASFAPIGGAIVVGRGRHGKVRKTPLASFDLAHGAQIAGTALFALGKDVLESTDDGGHWTLVPRPLPKYPVTAIAFVSPTTGYEVSGGGLFSTRNGGRKWKLILSADVTDISSMAQISFSSVSDGYVIGTLQGSEDVLMRTEDAGATWTPEILGFPLGSVTAAGAVDYAEGGASTSLFQTTDGGLSPNRSTLTLAIAGPRKLTTTKLKHAAGHVRLIGHLSPALEGETVTVSYLTNDYWHHKNVTVSSTGTFALTVTGVTSTTYFVAQWTGNDLVSGAGTVVTQLTVTHAKKKKKARAKK